MMTSWLSGPYKREDVDTIMLIGLCRLSFSTRKPTIDKKACRKLSSDMIPLDKNLGIADFQINLCGLPDT